MTAELATSTKRGLPPVVAFVGCFQDGKSTLINALLGEEYAKRGEGEATTSVPTLYEYGSAATEAEADINGCTVHIAQRCNKRLLRARLLDTPGWNSLHSEHDEKTKRVLSTGLVDFVVLVLRKATPPLASHFALLALAQKHGLPFAVVMNSHDWKDYQEGWSDSLERVSYECHARLKCFGFRVMPITTGGGVWPCVAAWLYPGSYFDIQKQMLALVNGLNEEYQRKRSGIHELRDFILGHDGGLHFPRITGVSAICGMLNRMQGTALRSRYHPTALATVGIQPDPGNQQER